MVSKGKENIESNKHEVIKETAIMENSRTDFEYFDERLTKLDDEKVQQQQKKSKQATTTKNTKVKKRTAQSLGNVSILELASSDPNEGNTDTKAVGDPDEDQFTADPPIRKQRKRKGCNLTLPRKKKKTTKKNVTSLEELIESKKGDDEEEIKEMVDISTLKEVSNDDTIDLDDYGNVCLENVK
jgi:hypothetical protein